MADTDTATPHTHDWAGETGETWLAHADRFEGMLSPVGAAFMDHAGFVPGEHVIDMGCGAGGTTRDIARRVAPGGSVTGIDISAALIAESRRRAEAEGIANARFVVADAATAAIEGAPFDRLFSRFGSMFFDDVPAAFANIRRQLRDGGRIDLAVWASPQENPWLGATREVIGRFLELPAPDPAAPGPMALADADRLRGLLEGAGFADVTHRLWRGPQLVGGRGASAAEAADFLIEAMPMASAMRDVAADVRADIRAALIDLLGGYAGPDGIAAPGAAWFVTARAG